MNFTELLQEKRVIFFDGAMGTSLQPYLRAGLPPEKLNLVFPQKVKAAHLSYIKQGVDVIETNTFGANRIKLDKFNLTQKLKDINYHAVKIAKETAYSQLVGASIGPLGNLVQPWGEITSSQALEVFREQIEILAEAGADIVVIETMMSLKEAKIAVVAAREVCDLPVVCQLTFGEQGRTLTGTDAETAVFTLEALNIEVSGANCSIGPEQMFPVVKAMVSCASKPLIFQPNAGNPHLVKGKTVFPVGPEEFSEWAKKFVESGVKIVGGCCGTTPEHIAAMVKNIKNISPPVKKHLILKGFSSRKKIYTFKKESPLFLGINFPLELMENEKENFDKILQLVDKAKEKGCSFLNLNFAKIPQNFKISSFMNFLQQNTDLGINMEIDKPSFVYDALSELEGKGLVFLSCSSWQEEEILTQIKKWGAAPGFNIYLDKKTQIKKEIEIILQKCKKIKMNIEEVVVKITLPPFSQFSFSFADVINKIKKVKSRIPVSVILQLNNFSTTKI
ncbi:homocysteine S-methyltransferase family protein [Candidatus Aerophobetes bacterium]|nr:homocysteine S-methyltransferase family protein [Candidatus Aerophobetes bacterium]